MCGIAGIVGFDSGYRPDHTLLERMTEVIRHRGPDDHGVYIKDNVAFGHCRLSIIDTSASGRQPMCNEDGTVHIVYNGEFYGFAKYRDELKKSGHIFKSHTDTEVIIHLYEEYGLDFIQKLDGIFAFSIWDERQKRLLLARDHLGVKPLYYTVQNDRVLFASEMKSILEDAGIERKVYNQSLINYLHFLSIPGDDSIIHNIKRLPPGHFLTLTNGEIDIRQYWDITDFSPCDIGFDDACRQLKQSLQEAVSAQMVADVPLGSFLSGGVDSSAIAALASSESRLPLSTFSISFPDASDFDEGPYARKVSEKYNTSHTEFSPTVDMVDQLPKIVWHADEPFAIDSAFALYFLAMNARKHVKVVMGGDGADEIFAGYPWRHQGNILDKRSRWLTSKYVRSGILPLIEFNRDRFVSFPIFENFSAMRYAHWVFRLQSFEILELLDGGFRDEVVRATRNNPLFAFFNKPCRADTLSRKLYSDIKTTLVSEMLTKVDRMTMAHGLEARVPFLDHRLVEWAFKLPSIYKIEDGCCKKVLKKSMEGILPDDIIYRSKQGFNVPLKYWMRGELKEFVTDVLFSKSFFTRGLFRQAAVERLLDDHFSERENRSQQIFILLMLELWYREFIDQ